MIKTQKSNVFILSLFILYILLLVWIILFKLQFSISTLDHIRSVNLIPFHYENEIGMNFHLKEVLENVLIFVPMGIYLCMITHEHKLLQKAAIIFGTSLALETAQYFLAIGSSDITDLLTNTIGGLIGILLYHIIVKILHNREHADKVITILAAAVTVLVISVLSLLLIMN